MVTVLAAVAVLAGAPRPVPAQGSLLETARDAAARGDDEAAVAAYEEILRRDRTSLEAMLELSTVYQRSGRLEYARGLLIRATRIDPEYPGIRERREAIEKRLVAALTAEVDSLISRGDYEAAIPRLSLHNTIDPGNADVHYKRALCLFEMGRYDAALSDIDVAIAASAQEPHFVLRDRITGEMKRGEIRRMAAQARTLVDSTDPYDRERALELLARILDVEPGHAWATAQFARLSAAAAATEQGGGGADTTGTTAIGSTAISLARDAAGALAPARRFAGRHLTALVALVIVWIVFRSPLTRALTRALSRRPVLAGDLSRFPVTEVLTMLNAGPHTGVLRVRGRSCAGTVYFENGEPCHCSAGGMEGEDALLALAGTKQRGTCEFFAGSATSTRTIDTPLSILLVDRAHRAGAAPAAAAPGKSRMKELLESRSRS